MSLQVRELSSGPPRFRRHPVLCPRGERGRGREGEGQLHRGHQGGGPGGGDRVGRGVREPGRGRMRGRKVISMNFCFEVNSCKKQSSKTKKDVRSRAETFKLGTTNNI